ncbi:DEKNAAC104599 [Brettanomyces naardenensis]|uniref:snRNP core protein D1 n=1 Tax=Brettanomyces naardenensis TaxID=13370 RepID=A0A448YRG1_BRENA|nr:DEKNAAC104599 [Brettanomyces naardenensis]
MKLVRFLMKLTSERVQVELKNGTVIVGDIISVTPTMNMNLKNVKMTVKDRNPTQLEFVNIRGNQVRLVILPDELNVDRVLTDSMTRPKKTPSTVAPPTRERRGGPRRQPRAF